MAASITFQATNAMADKHPIDEAIAAQRVKVEDATQYKAALQKTLQERTDERTALADDVTYGPQGNPFLEKADQIVRNLEGQIAAADEEIQTAARILKTLEQAKERQTQAGTPSNARAIAERIQELRATLADLDSRGQQLAGAFAADLSNEALYDDIALVDEKRKAAMERLALYGQAHAAALREEQTNARAALTLGAFTSREKAVTLAHQRVAVAEKIDQYLTGLAPLMREWREADDAVAAAVTEALRSVCEGANFNERSRIMQSASRAAARNSIAPAVAQALLLADVQDVTRDMLEFRYTSVIEAKRNPLTAGSLAAKTVQPLAAELDEAITKAGARHG